MLSSCVHTNINHILKYINFNWKLIHIFYGNNISAKCHANSNVFHQSYNLSNSKLNKTSDEFKPIRTQICTSDWDLLLMFVLYMNWE